MDGPHVAAKDHYHDYFRRPVFSSQQDYHHTSGRNNSHNRHRALHYQTAFGPLDAQNITAGIHRTLTTKQRLSMLANMTDLLGYSGNHHHQQQQTTTMTAAVADPVVCDLLIDAGAISALVLQLHFVVQRRQGNRKYNMTCQEVQQLCLVISILIRRASHREKRLEGTANAEDNHKHGGRDRCVPYHRNQLHQSSKKNFSTTTNFGGIEFINLLADVMQYWGEARTTAASVLSILHSLSCSYAGTLDILQSRAVLSQVVTFLLQSSALQRQPLSHHQQQELSSCLPNREELLQKSQCYHENHQLSNELPTKIPKSDTRNYNDIASPALLDALGILKNLTYYGTADTDSNGGRTLLLDVPFFLPALAGLPFVISTQGSHNGNGSSKKAMKRLSAVFRNFCLSSSTRTIIAQEPQVLGALFQLASNTTGSSGSRNSSVYINSTAFSDQKYSGFGHGDHRHGGALDGALDDDFVIRNLLQTFVQLAMGDRDSCIRLILFGDGMLLPILKRWMMLHQPHEHMLLHHQGNHDRIDHHSITADNVAATIRKRAARCLRLLTNYEETAAILLQQCLVPQQGDNDDSSMNLVSALSRAATHDENREVRKEASEALGKYAGFIQAAQVTPNQFKIVLDALCQLAGTVTGVGVEFVSNDNNTAIPCIATGGETGVSTSVLARALKEQAAYECNRILMAERQELLEALAAMAVLDESLSSSCPFDDTKEDACCALMHLSAEPSNQMRLATPSVLEALVQTSMVLEQPRQQQGRNYYHENNNISNTITSRSRRQRREYAVRSMVNLVTVESNRKIMVHHSNLLQSLIQFAVSTTTDSEKEIKKQVKHALLKLVSEL